MEPDGVPKSFGCLACFPRKTLKLSLHCLRSRSSSTNWSSPRSPAYLFTSKAGKREEELREVFRHFDGDGDGKISALELQAYFDSIGEHMSEEEAEGVIEDLDSDGDGLIDFRDFARLMRRDVGGAGDEDLKAAFEMFEFEGSGRITAESLQRVLRRLGESKSFDECTAMIQVYDTDGNGDLDFNEFHQMMVA